MVDCDSAQDLMRVLQRDNCEFQEHTVQSKFLSHNFSSTVRRASESDSDVEMQDQGAQQSTDASAANHELVPTKLVGLSFKCTFLELTRFFGQVPGLEIVPNSIKFGHRRDGRPDGTAAVLFPTLEMQALAVQKLNRVEVSHRRWVEMHEMDMEQYRTFGSSANDFREEQTTRLYKMVTAENQPRCLKLSGLPYSVFRFQIAQLFADFPFKEITIEQIRGRKTGFALVEL